MTPKLARRTFFLATLLLGTSLCGQTPALITPAASFASESYVVDRFSTVTSMNADGTGTRLQTFSLQVQSDVAVRQFSVVSLSFASQAEHAEFVYLRVVHADGTVQTTPVGDAIEQPAPVTREAPLYSDLKTKELPVKSLRLGDKLEWQTRFTIEHPEIPNHFWGQGVFLHGVVVREETAELRVPPGLRPTVWTNSRAGATFSETEEDGRHVYRFRHSDLHPTVSAEAEAAKKAEETRQRTPEEELDLTKGELPSFAWTTFPDWTAVGAWYRSLTAGRAAPDAAIRAKVAQLIAGKSTDLERAQAVYSYVSSQIRYIGIDFGIGRYQPHNASEVFANQYGDCKDKHELLASMLSVLGLRADSVLVGAGIRFNPAVPSPAAFNHLITRLPLGGKDVWLDSTAEIGPWASLLNVIRDQDALVIPPSSPAIIAHTPADLPYPQSSTASLVGSLNTDLTSESHMVFSLRSDDELYLRAALRSVPPANYGLFMQQMMAGMGFGGTTSEPAVEHLTDTAQPLLLSLHYHRLKEKDWGENRITAIFQPISLPSFTSERPPVISIQLGALRTEVSTVEMQLPEGWSAELPDAVHAHTTFATCDVTYRLSGSKLFAERRLVVLQSKVPIKDFPQYQSWYDTAGAGSYPYIQLLPPIKEVTTANLPPPKVPEAPKTPSDPRAAELVHKAMESMRNRDLDTARTDLDEAAKLNSGGPFIWSGYAGLAELLGKQMEMLADIRHELAFHPDELQFYRPTAQAELREGDPTRATMTLRAWVEAAPNDVEPALTLSRQLMRSKKAAEALEEANAALERLQSSGADLTALRVVAGEAQVNLGHTQQAASAVTPLLQTTSDPVLINGIAYILAQADVHLPEAYEAQTKLLAARNAESAAWTIAGNLRTPISGEINLAAEWDTMAWILYRQGKFSDAFAYADAARRITNQADIRDHLTTIAAALHNPKASSTLRDSDQQLRTFALGPARGLKGVASFILLLASGKVIESKLQTSETSSTPVLANASALLKEADLHALFPPGSNVRLVRTGFVNCRPDTCELILSPLSLSSAPLAAQ